MRAALFVGDETLRIDEIDVGDPAPGQVRVSIQHCGICRSDHSLTTSGYSPTPLVLGHEASGVVDAVGVGVTSLVPGDKVVLSPAATCGRCRACMRGEPSGCDGNKDVFTSTFADGTTGLSRGSDTVYRGMNVAGFAEQALVTESGAIKVPDDTPLDIACVLGCAVQTGVGAALNTADISPGDTVAVIGAGGIGLSVVQGAAIAGAACIVVSDPLAHRREQALAMGATHVVDPDAEKLGRVVRGLTDGRGADTVFEATGIGDLQNDAIKATRAAGTTVLVGAPPLEHTLSIPMTLTWAMSEKKLVGCFMGSSNSRRDIPRLLALWRSGRLDLESLITRRRPLEEINEGMTDLVTGVGIRTVIDL